VLINEPTGISPTGSPLKLHIDPENMSEIHRLLDPAISRRRALWRQGAGPGPARPTWPPSRSTGAPWPKTASFRAFAPENIEPPGGGVEVGAQVLVVGFPLGFHDTLHHLRWRAGGDRLVLRAAIRGSGYFLDRRGARIAAPAARLS